MRRREFIGVLGGAAAWPVVTRAQHPKRLPVIGCLWSPVDAEGAATRRLPLLNGLAELEYLPGKNFILEERYAGEVPERFSQLAAELVNLKVDILVGAGGASFLALRRATTTIPIVGVSIGDPVAQGFAVSLSKPGGNVSGISQMPAELVTKRLQLFHRTLANVSRLALLRRPANILTAPLELSQYSSAAKDMGLSYEVFDVNATNEIDAAFQKIKEQDFPAVTVFNDNLFLSERKTISALGLKYRLAVLAYSKWFVDDGVMLSYGPDFSALWHSAARFVDKILKGERVGDIPIQQPTKFEFCINLKTAKALGIEIAPAMLALADEVVD